MSFSEPSLSSTRQEGALEPYLRALSAHWRLVLAVTAAALLGAIFWVSARTPDYSASAQLLVTPVDATDTTFEGVDVLRGDSGDTTRTVQTAAALIESPEAASATARRVGHGQTRSTVETAVEVVTKGETNILSVTAKAEDPKLAAQLANSYAASALAERGGAIRRQVQQKLVAQRRTLASGQLSGDAAAQLADSVERLRSAATAGDPAFTFSQRAVVPTASIGTPAWLIIGLALIAGFTLGTGAALILELTNRRIRDEEELRRLYPLPVLAHVPVVSGRARRALRNPLATPPIVREAFRTLQVQLDRQAQLPRVLMLTSASSGDAKTTSAANLAITLVSAGHRVIAIDFDLRKPDLGRVLDVTPRARLSTLLTNDTPLRELLVDVPRVPSLQVLPTGDDRDVVLLEPLTRRLPQLFEEARALADYVIVDTPPLGEVSDALRLVDLVDDVVVAARPGHTNRANVELMRDLLGRAGRTPTGFLVVGEAPGSVNTYYTYGMGSRQSRATATGSSKG
jgi:capsular exopolysaccharide synthesis family protein